MKPPGCPRGAALVLATAVFLAGHCPGAEMEPAGSAVPESTRGLYFAKKAYVPQPLPTFAESKGRLPSPILEKGPDLVTLYWKCWELAFRSMMRPPPGSPLVSNWLDASFNDNIFQWDSIFITMFARYGNKAFPAIQTLDNFYCRQRKDGFIGRELRRKDGTEVYTDGPSNIVNPPLFSWAEVESFRLTGDRSRFAEVLPVLERYVAWLNRDGNPDTAGGPDWERYGRRAAGSVHHLYWNTPLGSGMDDTPRHGNGWVDMSCQMVIQYENLATMCDELSLPEKAKGFRTEAAAIGRRINCWCWNEEDGFYYDVDNDGRQFRVKTAGGFWPLLAGIATRAQAERLVAHLRNRNEFWRPFLFPTLSANDARYQSDGGYWLGGVWAPTDFMIIKGLDRYGYEDLASMATERYLNAMLAVYRPTQTVWEDYAPETPFRPGNPSKRDFVGWTGDGPIALLIEDVLGFRCDGARHRLSWRLTRTDRHGIERLQVGDSIVSVVCAARMSADAPAFITASCDAPVDLDVRLGNDERVFKLQAGRHDLAVLLGSAPSEFQGELGAKGAGRSRASAVYARNDLGVIAPAGDVVHIHRNPPAAGLKADAGIQENISPLGKDRVFGLGVKRPASGNEVDAAKVPALRAVGGTQVSRACWRVGRALLRVTSPREGIVELEQLHVGDTGDDPQGPCRRRAELGLHIGAQRSRARSRRHKIVRGTE